VTWSSRECDVRLETPQRLTQRHASATGSREAGGGRLGATKRTVKVNGDAESRGALSRATEMCRLERSPSKLE